MNEKPCLWHKVAGLVPKRQLGNLAQGFTDFSLTKSLHQNYITASDFIPHSWALVMNKWLYSKQKCRMYKHDKICRAIHFHEDAWEIMDKLATTLLKIVIIYYASLYVHFLVIILEIPYSS